MKKAIRFLAVVHLAVVGCMVGGAGILQGQTWQQIPIPQLPAFHPKEPKRVELPNGMVVFLQEDHELPLIDAMARIRGGSRTEPAAKIGLVSLYGEVWRTGGTKTQTGDQLDDYLEVRAAKVETDGGADSTTIGMSCLKEDFDDVFKVLTDLLRNPEFRGDKLELAKREAADAISRRNDEITQIAAREATKLAYGAENPYAREPEYATVAAVNRQDLVDWHKAYVYPNNIIFGIVGDFDSTQMEAKLRKAFGDWQKGPAAKAPEIQFQSAKPGFYLIKKEDVNQSWIRMVALGTTRKNPDYYAIEVLNEAFGGGFSARLIQSIRTAQGLAYAVGGGIGTRFDHPGILQLAMATKSQTTVESIQALFNQIDELKTKPISDEEMKRAKDAILNAFVFNFDTPEKVMRERMAYEFYGYPADFLERYRTGVEKVTTADVARVAQKYLHKDQLAVLVTGNANDFDKPLSTLGQVKDVDITIPPPPGEKSAGGEGAAPEEKKASDPAGKALAAKVVQALGGENKLQSVKGLKSNFIITQQGGMGTVQVESTIMFPDHMRANLQTPQGTFSMVVTPTAAFMAAEGMGSQDMPASRRADSMEQMHRDLVYLAQHVNDPSFSFSSSAEKPSDNTAAVDVAGPGVSVRWFVDPQSGRIVRETYKGIGQSGPVDTETIFSEWKPVEGLTLPFHRENKQGGAASSTVQFSSIQLNPQTDPKMFEKPAAAAQGQ